MGRNRQAIQSVKKGGSEVVRFRHPLKGKTVAAAIGVGDQAIKNLEQLNRIFLNRHNWTNIPHGTNDRVRAIWLGARLKRKGKGGDKAPDLAAMVEQQQAVELARLYAVNEQQARLIEKLSGQAVRQGPVPTLREAYDAFKVYYTGRDSEHTKNVLYDLDRFVKKFGETRDVDSFRGNEAELDTWLRGLKITDLDKDGKPRGRHGAPIGAGRKHRIRIYVLKLLEHAGVRLSRKDVAPIKRKDIERDRGPIRWLERKQALRLSGELSGPWADMFRVQVSIGLRPSELITLKRTDFSPNFSEVFLSSFDIHTLKTGTRHIQVPVEIRKIIKARLKKKKAPERKGRWKAYPAALEKRVDLVFPNPYTGERWPSDRHFYRKYAEQIQDAAAAAGIAMVVDCRTGRRTCGSLLLRSGMKVEDVAAILGDRPETIREHYARILSGEVNPSAAAI